MKITLLTIGKTEEDYLKQGIALYAKRLTRYIEVQLSDLPALKNTKNISETEQKNKEGELILKQVPPSAMLVLLDEKGREFDSPGFAGFLQQQMNGSVKELVFVVGGPYGFSEAVYKRAQHKLSLSKLTFSHQMVRLFFAEQLYRAMTILKGEPYHHS